MADPNDIRGTKTARSTFGRKGVDVTMADVRVIHGVLHVRGVVRAIKGYDIKDVAQLKDVVDQACKMIKTKADIKDIVLDLAYRET